MERWHWTTALAVLAAASLVLISYVLAAQPEGSWAALAASIQALATVLLVIVTIHFAEMVETQADAAQDSAKATRRSVWAAEHMAKLQTRQARADAVATLTRLGESLRDIEARLEDWEDSMPSWQSRTAEGTASRLPYGSDDVEAAREMVIEAVADEDRRARLLETITRMRRFLETAAGRDERGTTDEDASEWVRQALEEARSLRGALEDSIDLVGRTREELQ